LQKSDAEQRECKRKRAYNLLILKTGDDMAQFIARVTRAAKLEPRLYEEVATDTAARWQAVGVVVLSSLAAGIGSASHTGLGGLVIGWLVALSAWYIWALLTYLIGAKLFPTSRTSVSHREVWRTLGFASAPGVLRVFGAVPGCTGTAFLVAAVWMLIAAVVAVRQALDYASTARAIGVCLPGWFVHVFLILFLLLLLGQGE
jgi:hypothetical protein